jgi:hypothetical protein
LERVTDFLKGCLSKEFLLTLAPVVVGIATLLGYTVDVKSVEAYLVSFSAVILPVLTYTVARTAVKRAEIKNPVFFATPEETAPVVELPGVYSAN